MVDRPGPRRRSLAGRLRSIFATAEQREADELEARSRESGAEPIAGAVERSRVRFRGTITAVTTVPSSGWLEAELTDGTGKVTLVWMGRRQLQCVAPGTDLVVAGRLSTDADGRLVIYNPDYAVVP